MDHPDQPDQPGERGRQGRGDPKGFHARRGGGTARARRRRWWAWLLLTAALALLGFGMVAGDGVWIAAGLIAAVLAVQLLTGGRRRDRRRKG